MIDLHQVGSMNFRALSFENQSTYISHVRTENIGCGKSFEWRQITRNTFKWDAQWVRYKSLHLCHEAHSYKLIFHEMIIKNLKISKWYKIISRRHNNIGCYDSMSNSIALNFHIWIGFLFIAWEFNWIIESNSTPVKNKQSTSIENSCTQYKTPTNFCLLEHATGWCLRFYSVKHLHFYKRMALGFSGKSMNFTINLNVNFDCNPAAVLSFLIVFTVDDRFMTEFHVRLSTRKKSFSCAKLEFYDSIYLVVFAKTKL